MTCRLFAMDTSFFSALGSYDFDARCEMLAELGYDGTYLTVWNDQARRDLPRLASVKSRFGLEVAGVWFTLDLAAANGPTSTAGLATALESLNGADRIELCIRLGDKSIAPSDPAADPRAADALRRLLDIAERRQLTLLLYPHANDWLEKLPDAVRLCRRIDHPRLAVVFCGFHWYFKDNGNLPAELADAAPYLRSVNLCGSSRPGGPGTRPTIEPLDRGDLDNFAILGLLRRVGYDGWVGIQGYSVGGDAYAHLRRSRDAFLDMLSRLDAHPHWANLRRPA